MITMRIGKDHLARGTKIRTPAEAGTVRNCDYSLLEWITESALFQEWVRTFPADHECWNITFTAIAVRGRSITRLKFLADMRKISEGSSQDASHTVELSQEPA